MNGIALARCAASASAALFMRHPRRAQASRGFVFRANGMEPGNRAKPSA